ncbi:tRNA-specific adenosine deaminase 1 [Lunasporangiospora selenospora]|uniref:tRNA-specific adenosine deaminase 1 n=1 Tax=Lunasporangiospora selenospora TaxID=979761 RepID=A0A9P6FW00_9FUNG|nr:tRNA-specific adenosine deaminase 1 [Lunasporangiospora selenospora]
MGGDATTGSLALVQSEESRNAFLAGQGQPMDHATSEPITGFKHGRDTTPNAAVPGEEVQPITKQSKLDPTSLIGSTEPQPVPTLSDTTAVSALVDKTISEKDSSLSSHAQGDCPCVLGFRRGRFDYNSVSVLRTKPGRVDSEPTLSMSCSDKIARWNLLGLTSALVTPFLKEPIFLSSLITLELFDAEALERALNQRTRGCGQHAPSLDSKALSGDIHGWPKTPRQLKISCTEIAFEYSKAEVQALSEKEDSSDIPVASGSSICWVVSSYSPTAAEVLVNGCKAGASTKKGVQPKSRSQLCKLNMFESSVALWDAVSKSIAPNPTAFQQLPQIVRTLLGWPRVTTQIEGNDKPILQEIVYRDWKALSPGYVAMKETLFQGLFRNWQRSDRSLESFNRHGKVITSTTIEK